jgi:hypothetical protein
MYTTDEAREQIEHFNAHDFDFGMERIAEDVKFHAPGLGQDLQGRDAMLKMLRGWGEAADVRSEVMSDVVELGPFSMVMLRHTVTLDGQRSAYDVLLIDRWEGDKTVESWSLRASEPSPTCG